MSNIHYLPRCVPPPPSIGALRAFEAASRLLSFTAAADELHVTQSAISHAIRDLEARFSAALFRRNGRSLDLTDEGRRYAPFVREALARLAAGEEAVTDPERRARVLTVSVSPSFAAKWLAPRIGGFARAHPDLDLRISAAAQHVDFSDNDIDLAIRHGDGNWPALAAVKLCHEWQVPVCRPGLIATDTTPAQLIKAPLIHHCDGKAWREWFSDYGVDLKARPGPSLTYNEMSLTIDAACEGQGVALARTALVARDLAGGRVVIVGGRFHEATFGYWIVRPKGRTASPKIRRFIKWLRQETAADIAILKKHLSDRMNRSDIAAMFELRADGVAP